MRTPRARILLIALLLSAAFPASAADEPLVAAGATAEIDPALRLDTLPSLTPVDAFVHFRSGTPDAQRALADDHGLTVVAEFEAVGALFVTGTAGDLRTLSHEPAVEYLEANRTLRFSGDTGPWATRVRVAQEDVAGGPYLDDQGRILDGTGVGVAVIDSGVDGTHTDLRSRVGRNFKIVCGSPGLINATTERCFSTQFGASAVIEVPAQTNTDTTGGHGTHVSGIVAGDGTASTVAYDEDGAPATRGTFTGIAPRATLYGFSTGETIFVFTAAEALEYIYANFDTFDPPIRVINNSWGDDGGTAYKPNSVISQMVKKLVEEKGVTVVFAAGNDGGTGSTDATSSYSKDPTPGVLSVANYYDRAAAGDHGTGNRDAVLDTTSSRGRNGQPTTYPDVSAPGTLIRSACTIALPVCNAGPFTSNPLIYVPQPQWEPFYATISGTSMAAPHTAGVAALLYQARPAIAPATIEDVLQDTAHRFTAGGAYGADPQNPGSMTSFDKGAGLVDVEAALNALGVTHDDDPTGTPPAVHVTQPAEGSSVDGLTPIDVSGTATDGTVRLAPPPPARIVTADAGDYAGPGAADITSLGAQEEDAGMRYTLGLRNVLELGPSGSVELRVTQNVGGRPSRTGIVLSTTGASTLPAGTTITSPATSVAVDPLANEVTFFVPFANLGNPPAGTPAHNVFASTFVGAIQDVAPSPEAPATTGADVLVRPAYGRPYTIVRPEPVVPPVAEVRLAVDGGTEQETVEAGTSPSYTWSTTVDPNALADGPHTLEARLYLDGVLATTHQTTVIVARPRVYEIIVTEPVPGSTVARGVVPIRGTAFTDDPAAREVIVDVTGPGYASGPLTATGVETWAADVDLTSSVAGDYTVTASLVVAGVTKATATTTFTLPSPPDPEVSCAPRGLGFWRAQFGGGPSAVFLPAEREALGDRAAELSNGYFDDRDDVVAGLTASPSVGAEARAARQFAALLLNLAAGERSSSMTIAVGLSGAETLDPSVYATGTIGGTVDAAAAWVRAQFSGGDIGGANEVAGAINAGIGLICG